ncbi:MAG: GNAT family N-acetyltransferase [Deinococcota bacterium]
MTSIIKQASLDELDDFLPLFDAYRVFHGLDSDLEGARAFLTARLRSNEATVFIAYNAETNQPSGFVLLYKVYSNHAMASVIVLNDLFTTLEYRGQGVGQALVQQAMQYTKDSGAGKLRLFTTKDNTTAKRLYEYLGFVQEQGFDIYELSLA